MLFHPKLLWVQARRGHLWAWPQGQNPTYSGPKPDVQSALAYAGLKSDVRAKMQHWSVIDTFEFTNGCCKHTPPNTLILLLHLTYHTTYILHNGIIICAIGYKYTENYEEGNQHFDDFFRNRYNYHLMMTPNSNLRYPYNPSLSNHSYVIYIVQFQVPPHIPIYNKHPCDLLTVWNKHIHR